MLKIDSKYLFKSLKVSLEKFNCFWSIFLPSEPKFRMKTSENSSSWPSSWYIPFSLIWSGVKFLAWLAPLTQNSIHCSRPKFEKRMRSVDFIAVLTLVQRGVGSRTFPFHFYSDFFLTTVLLQPSDGIRIIFQCFLLNRNTFEAFRRYFESFLSISFL